MAVGATSILTAGAADAGRGRAHLLATQRPTIFYGVPTLYAAMLASAELPSAQRGGAARCVSAGEALPEDIGRRWSERFGVEILDGLGSTEMLHIFLSNRPGDGALRHQRRAGAGLSSPRSSTMTASRCAPGEIGELHVSGPTSAAILEQPRALAHDLPRPVDAQRRQILCDADGYYTYCGRTDDMLKVGGI